MALEAWLLARQTVKVMGLVLDHSKMTTAAVELLGKCIQDAMNCRGEELQKSFQLLQQKEHEADVLRRSMIEELARGELPSDDRVGLMRLGRQLDWIIDWAHEGGRVLVMFDLSKMPRQIQDILVEMCSATTQGTSHIVKTVQELIDGHLDESLKEADEVERLEETVDSLHQKARGILKDMDTGEVSVGSIILLSQFLEAVENTSDRCEDACDQARVMAVTLSKRKE
jgi:predicted phosphate transport protein (TIGR00153 family)